VILFGFYIFSLPKNVDDQDKESVEVTLWVFKETDAQINAADWLVKSWNEQHHDIKVNLELKDWGAISETLLPSALKGEPATDVCLNIGYQMKELAEYGYLEPLDEYLKVPVQYIDDHGQYVEVVPLFYRGVKYRVEDIHNLFWTETKWHGTSYSLPYGGSSTVLIYRPDYLEDANVTPPTNQQELEIAIKKLTEYGKDKDIHSLYITDFPNSLYCVWKSWNNEISIIKEIEGKYFQDFNNSKIFSATEYYLDLIRGYDIPIASTQEQSEEAFELYLSGKVAMFMVNSVELVSSLQISEIPYEIIPNPICIGPEGDGHSLDINQYSVILKDITIEKKQAAWSFLLWAAQGEPYLQNMIRVGMVPLDQTIQDNYTKAIGDTIAKPFIHSVNTASWASPTFPSIQKVLYYNKEIIWNKFLEAIDYKITSRDFVIILANEVQEELNMFYFNNLK
jgi:ABC-type glycerol-3-phosphate transport system substrate-binding protein